MKKVLVLAGPTAVGKSDFSIEIAKKFNLNIISGDSIQVYRGLDIGSGKITKEEMQGVHHDLIDILSPKDSYSVSMFQKEARRIIEESDKTVLICGGTGLYLKAVLYDYTFEEKEEEMPEDPVWAEMSDEELYALLKEKDPAQALKIHPHNRRRVVRSLLIQKETGRTQSEIEQEQKHEMIYDAFIIGATMDREKLYDRINQRVEKMFADGLEEEIRSLLDSGVSFSDQSMQGIGYKEWKPYFEGTSTKEEVKAQIQLNSRRFAKRQYTWFNHQMPMHWVKMDDAEDRKRILGELSVWLG